jgi:hypothetical protein
MMHLLLKMKHASPTKNARGVVIARTSLCSFVVLLLMYLYVHVHHIKVVGVFPYVLRLGGQVQIFERQKSSPCSTSSNCETVDPAPIAESKDKVTIVLMGYERSRAKNYRKLFARYLSMPETVDRVIFIWNNLEKPPPAVPEEVTLIQAEKNNMMNRYILAHGMSNVDALLTIDDDVLLDENLLRCMLAEFRENSDSIIGLDARHVDADNGNYMSKDASLPGSANVIIGKTMLMHRKFHVLASKADEALRDAALKGAVCQSCDDLVMNAIVSNYTKTGPVVLRSDIWPFVRYALPAPGGVSNKPKWYGKKGRRSTCLRWLMKHFDVDELFKPKGVQNELRCVAAKSAPVLRP